MLSELFDSLIMRAACAAGTSLLLVGWLLPHLIRVAQRGSFSDRDGKSDSNRLNQLHQRKRSTPIVGGIAILGGVLFATLSFSDLSCSQPWVLLVTLCVLGSLGFADDLQKTFGGCVTRGLSARQKLVAQVALGAGLGLWLIWHTSSGSGQVGLTALTRLQIPFVDAGLQVGAVGFLVLTMFLVTGSSNAVNLTDGLDGLAGGCGLVALGVYVFIAATVGDATLASHLGLQVIEGSGEVCVVLASAVGALTAFLWFNRHPAKVFMGDTGALPLGGVLAVAAVLLKQELLLALVGGVFVAEAASVMIQVGWYKLTKRRVFRCAPLHHHFEFKGWAEHHIVDRFHGIALLMGLISLAGFGLGS